MPMQTANNFKRWIKASGLAQRNCEQCQASEDVGDFIAREMIKAHEWHAFLKAGYIHLERLRTRVTGTPKENLKWTPCLHKCRTATLS